MFSKLGLAAAIIAVGSFMTFDIAEAKRGDGANRHQGGSASNSAQRGRNENRNRNGNRRRNTRTAVTPRVQHVTPPVVTAPPPVVRRRKKKKKGWKKFGRILRNVAKVYIASQQNQYRGRNHHVSRDHNIVRELPQARWSGGQARRHDRASRGRGRWRNRDRDHRCVAVAKRGRGYGRRIGIRGEGFGRRACRKAMRRCENRLDRRQSHGRNRRAACVVVNRG